MNRPTRSDRSSRRIAQRAIQEDLAISMASVQKNRTQQWRDLAPGHGEPGAKAINTHGRYGFARVACRVSRRISGRTICYNGRSSMLLTFVRHGRRALSQRQKGLQLVTYSSRVRASGRFEWWVKLAKRQ